jgi:hypothetical protein
MPETKEELVRNIMNVDEMESEEFPMSPAIIARTTSIDLLSVHILKEDFASLYQQRYLLQYLFIGKVGVWAFCERLEVLSSYTTLSPPHNNARFSVLTEQERQAILHDAPPPPMHLKDERDKYAIATNEVQYLASGTFMYSH